VFVTAFCHSLHQGEGGDAPTARCEEFALNITSRTQDGQGRMYHMLLNKAVGSIVGIVVAGLELENCGLLDQLDGVGDAA
jgi:hypothetical protein